MARLGPTPPSPVWPPAGPATGPVGGPVVGPAPGWYPDPGGTHQFRFWSGYGWTPGVADNGRVSEDWQPPGANPQRASPWPQQVPDSPAGPDTRIQLPKRAFLLSLAGIVLALVLAVVGAAIAEVISPHSMLLELALSQAGLYAGLLWAVWLASSRHGTGNVWRDFGVRAEKLDAVRGLGYSVVARVAGLLVLVPVLALDKKFGGSDLQPLKDALHHPDVMILLIVIALVGAPFVEELFFRGLVQRAALPLVGTAGAIAVQAVVFASLHMRPSYGLGNVSVFVGIAVMGAVQGWVADRYRRLGPGMWSHGFFNLAAVLATTVR